MQSPDGSQLLCPSQSLWSLITEHVTQSELPKIHAALGDSLVNVYTAAHSEAKTWHKLWQESQHGNKSSRAGTPLADPPAVKELVRAEVKMLLQNLRDRASIGGRDGEELVFRYKPETVDYALGHRLTSCFRNCSDSEDTDNGSRPSSRCSLRSNAEEEIEAIRDKLNVNDIDEVVGRLRSILTEECDALKTLVKQIKGNMKQKCRSHCDEPEPSLAELRELRGAIQTDLENYPSSFAASLPASSTHPLKGLTNRPRLSVGQRVSEESPQAFRTTSALRPHPPPPRYPLKPRPPPPKTSASAERIDSTSLSQTHRQHRRTLALTGPSKTTTCNRITSPGCANSHFTTSLPGPADEEIMVKTTHRCDVSLEQHLHRGTPTSSPILQIKTPRISSIDETQLSSHLSPSRKCDLSPQPGRKSSPAWRLRNINTITSLTPPHCDAGSNSSNNTRHSVSTTGKSKAQNSTFGGGSVSTTHNDGRESTSEGFHSCVGSRKSNTGIDRNRNGPLGKDAPQQQSLVATV